MDDLHEEDFNKRLGESEKYTGALIELLLRKKCIKSYRKATLEEDKSGVDGWVEYFEEEGEVPMQFKLRAKKNDVPVVRYQPFRGIDNVTTVEGRDWRGLHGKVTREYYVAIRGSNKKYFQIYRVPCEILRQKTQALQDAWANAEKTNPDFFTSEVTKIWVNNGIRNRCVFYGEDGSQVWWKKNWNEGSPKFNMYIPWDCRVWEYNLSNDDALLVESIAKGEKCLKT